MNLLSSPELGPDTLVARAYQNEAVAHAREALRKNRSTLVILPTGTGKTVLFAKISRLVVERGGRVLVLAHRGELIDQAANVLERVGIVPAIEKAGAYARASFDPSVVVATIQTMQRDRLATWPTDFFRLVIVDEAHHATTKSYRSIIQHFATAKVLGVTATPDRSDDDAVAGVFGSVAYEMSIWDAMTAPPPGPYLCRLQFCQCDVGIDLRNIRTTGRDFNRADLEERIRPLIDTLANAIRQEIGDRRTLIFTPDVGSAMAMATALQSLGLRADWVAGDSPDRADKISRYKLGEIQILANCALLCEGFDAPETSAVVLCRPTKSRPFYSQMVGRGTRLSPGKTNCLLVDFNFLTEKHDLVRPADLFDTTGTDSEVLEIADAMLRAAPNQDILEIVERSRETQRERQLVRIKARERKVSYRKVSFDPLSVADVLAIPMRGSKDAVIGKASERQAKYLASLGVTEAENLSKRRASKLIDVLQRRRIAGLATLKQVSWLIAKGVDTETARGMTKVEATDALGQLFDSASVTQS